MVTKSIDTQEVAAFLSTVGPATKVYIGCDSERIKMDGKWYADYTTVLVVHIDSSKGCKIFGEIVRELDYDQNKKKPRMRLLNEATKASELYNNFKEIISEFETYIHLDINPNKKYNSSIVIQEAIGYVKGMTGIVPVVKNEAWAASFAADRYKEIMSMAKRQAQPEVIPI